MLSPEYSVSYLDGLKNYQGQVVEFNSIMLLKDQASFSGFLEGLNFAWGQTDSDGLHFTDPNWYEEGNYQTVALDPKLHDQLEEFFRAEELLDDDQTLTSLCHYSDNPEDHNGPRPQMMVGVSGGEHEDSGQFISCWLDDNTHSFDFNPNRDIVAALRRLAQQTGRRELSSEEYWQQYLEKQKKKPD